MIICFISYHEDVNPFFTFQKVLRTILFVVAESFHTL